MANHHLHAADLEHLAARGISRQDVEHQLELLEHPPAPLHLDRPCTPGDGIRALDDLEQRRCLEAYETARASRHLLKFVPASGAASRMFQSLLAAEKRPADLVRALDADEPPGASKPADRALDEARRFFQELPRFAFHPLLAAAARAAGFTLQEALQRGEPERILALLLHAPGLGYAARPKGLIPFHQAPEGPRTAFEEHLVEGAAYVAQRDCRCRLHFTVPPMHQDAFATLLERLREQYERRRGVCYEVAFSTQKPSTDTIAVDLENRPFRLANGELLLRAGGHGALIENLNDMRGDIVFLKNIDNVTVEHLLDDTVRWKKILCGYLCRVQSRLFAHVEALRASDPSTPPADVLHFARHELCLTFPDSLATADPGAVRQQLLARLERPLRVCGMVQNTGEPGGGPFWVRGADGLLSLQVVERAQTDGNSTSQQRIFESATHFSPVDFVCGVRDSRGRPFELSRFVDPQAVFVAQKSAEGRALKALERPGLWNGAMAHWITLFVEVPISTFNPVKTVLDLLRPAHQAS